MAVTPRIMQQVNDLGTLKELVELMKNPQAIVDTHETARREMQLTEAEELKMAQARAFLADYDRKVADLEARRSAAEQAQERTRQAIEEHNNAVTREHDKLNDRKTALDAADLVIKEKIQIHEADKKLLVDEKAAAAEAFLDRDDACKKREEECLRRENANKREDERLALERSALAKRAKALKEAIEG